MHSLSHLIFGSFIGGFQLLSLNISMTHISMQEATWQNTNILLIVETSAVLKEALAERHLRKHPKRSFWQKIKRAEIGHILKCNSLYIFYFLQFKWWPNSIACGHEILTLWWQNCDSCRNINLYQMYSQLLHNMLITYYNEARQTVYSIYDSKMVLGFKENIYKEHSSRDNRFVYRFV